MPNTGIETVTLRSLARRSNQLSYAARLLVIVLYALFGYYKKGCFVSDSVFAMSIAYLVELKLTLRFTVCFNLAQRGSLLWLSLLGIYGAGLATRPTTYFERFCTT